MPGIIIAIDGLSSCGKSTLAKGLARALHYAYLDSGAMYRAVTLYFLDHGVDFTDEESVRRALEHIHIHFERINGENHTFLNGQDVEEAIREMRVNKQVSPVSAIPLVRRAMVRQQQMMGRRKSIVMDGRDIGTVVFPEAELKLFVQADLEIRTERRYQELLARGHQTDRDTVRQNLAERDRIDSTRDDSPLRQAEDAIVIDTTHLTEEEQLARALALAAEVVGKTAL